jgi:hypothetical protein
MKGVVAGVKVQKLKELIDSGLCHGFFLSQPADFRRRLTVSRMDGE